MDRVIILVTSSDRTRNTVEFASGKCVPSIVGYVCVQSQETCLEISAMSTKNCFTDTNKQNESDNSILLDHNSRGLESMTLNLKMSIGPE